MDNNKEFQEINSIKVEHDCGYYSSNNNVHHFEDRKEVKFVSKNKIKCERKCFDIVDKWITRVIIKIPTGDDMNKIIEREIMMLKVKYPFLPEKQLQGKALVKFGIPNLMGNIIRTAAVTREEITKTIVQKFSSQKIKKDRVPLGFKVGKKFILCLKKSETFNFGDMSNNENLPTTLKSEKISIRKRKNLSSILTTNYHQDFLPDANKIQNSYIKTSKTSAQKKVKSYVECSPAAQSYVNCSFFNQFKSINSVNDDIMKDISPEYIFCEREKDDGKINDKIEINRIKLQQQTNMPLQKIKTYAECSPATFKNVYCNGNHTVDISDKKVQYISECSPMTNININNNLEKCILKNSNYTDNNENSLNLNSQQQQVNSRKEGIYFHNISDIAFDDDDDDEGNKFPLSRYSIIEKQNEKRTIDLIQKLAEKKLNSITKEHNYHKNDNLNFSTVSNWLPSSISLSSSLTNFTDNFWLEMSGHDFSGYNEKLQLSLNEFLPSSNSWQESFDSIDKKDNSISQVNFSSSPSCYSYTSRFKILDVKDKTEKNKVIPDCSQLSNVCCEYDKIGKKIAYSPKMIISPHNYENNSKIMNRNEIQKLILRNIAFLKKDCN